MSVAINATQPPTDTNLSNVTRLSSLEEIAALLAGPPVLSVIRERSESEAGVYALAFPDDMPPTFWRIGQVELTAAGLSPRVAADCPDSCPNLPTPLSRRWRDGDLIFMVTSDEWRKLARRPGQSEADQIAALMIHVGQRDSGGLLQ